MDRTRHHFYFLDYIRGIAILAVFTYHCLGAAFRHDQLAWGHWLRNFSDSKFFLMLLPATFGYAGVPIFFVVSGFCIHLSHLRSLGQDWKKFYTRRFFRIYPPYLVALLIFAFVFPLTRISFHSKVDSLLFFSHFFLIHNFASRSFYGINPAFWSIAVEFQLYLMYPMLLNLTRRWGWQRTLYLLGGIEIFLRGSAGFFSLITGKDIPWWYLGIPFLYWFSWSLGATLADAFIQERKLPLSSIPPIFWLALAVVANFVKPLAPFSFLLFSATTASYMAHLLLRPEQIQSTNPILRHLRTLGTLSYSFYLIHQPLIAIIPALLYKLENMRFNSLEIFFICCATYPLILGISWLFFTYCEIPSNNLGKRHFTRRNPANTLTN